MKNNILSTPGFCWLIHQMMKVTVPPRMELPAVRLLLDDLRNNSQITANGFEMQEMDRIATQNTSAQIQDYIQDLDNIS